MDSTNWGYFIKRLREERGLSQLELAKRSGVNRGHIYNIEKGKYKSSSAETRNKLARGLGLTPEHLSRIISGRQAPAVESAVDLLRRVEGILVALPVHSEIYFHAGGKGMEPVTEYAYLTAPIKPGQNLEAYRVVGACMEPDIHSGDLIIIDTNAEILPGDLVACSMSGMLKIAHAKKIDGQMWLENGHERVPLDECARPSKIIQSTHHY